MRHLRALALLILFVISTPDASVLQDDMRSPTVRNLAVRPLVSKREAA